MRLLITRPLPDGQRTATALRALGHEVLLTPLMQVKPIAADLAGAWSGVIITSANAMRAIDAAQRASLRNLPLFAVGERSAQAARDVGFREVRSAHGDARDLVALIEERHAGSEPYLYLAGEDRAADIEGDLARQQIAVKTAVVYRNMTTGFPLELIAALERGNLDAVLHFSRRSAENYLIAAKTAGLIQQALSLRQLCLSAHVAEPVQSAKARDVTVASRPDEAALLELVRPVAT